MDNREIAVRLRVYAEELSRSRESLYRVRAYRRAAQTILFLDRPVEQILHTSGTDGVAALPGIGAHLAFTLRHLIETGELKPHPRSGEARYRAGSGCGSQVA
jgi:DNA polymerase (family X)